VLDAGETSQVTLSVSNPGPVALADVNVALTTSIAGLTVTPPSIAVGALDAYSDTTVTFNVALDASVTAALASDLKVNVTSSNGCANVTIPIIAPLNTDDKPASSSTDNFDAVTSIWNPMGSPSVWSHVRESGLDAMWSGADPSFTSDASLVSPPITAGSGNLTITFSHRFAFEFTPASGATPLQAFDGGVIEYTTDGGATWTDFGLIANPGYTTNLVVGGTNPLNGRRAYGANNPSFPSTDNITMFIGNRLAGKTFQMRFRAGSDSNGGGAGWQIDDVKFTGIVGTPFPTLVPDASRCAASSTGAASSGQVGADPAPESTDQPVAADAGNGGCQVGGGLGAGALLALAVLVRRRRR